MSYFTDDTEPKSSPVVIDPNNIKGQRLSFGEHFHARTSQMLAGDIRNSESLNEMEAFNERMKIIGDHSGIDPNEALSEYGYKRNSGLNSMVPNNKGANPDFALGEDKNLEDAIRAYGDANPDIKGKLFYGEGAKEWARELGRKKYDEASKKLEHSNYGFWTDLTAGFVAYNADPLFLLTQVIAPQVAFGKLAARGVQLSLGARIGTSAAVDATAGFAYELPAQKLQIQPYKHSLGLEHTNTDVRNAVFGATVIGGVFGGASEFIAGAFRRVRHGQWTPVKLKAHFAENYEKLTPEEKQMADMAIQAMDHELANPYGPEGRQKYNEEMAEYAKRAATDERQPTDIEIEQSVQAVKRSEIPEDVEFNEIRDYAMREAGLIEEPQAKPETNPMAEYEAQIRSLTDSLEVGDEVAVDTLRQAGLDEQQTRDAIDYAVQSGILKRDESGNLTFAKVVDEQAPEPEAQAKAEPKDREGLATSLNENKDPLTPELQQKADAMLPPQVRTKMVDEIQKASGQKFSILDMFSRKKKNLTDEQLLEMSDADAHKYLTHQDVLKRIDIRHEANMARIKALQKNIEDAELNLFSKSMSFSRADEYFVKALEADNTPHKFTRKIKDGSEIDITIEKEGGISKYNVIATKDGKQISEGIAEYNPSSGDGEITRIEVDESMRRQGVATAIYDALDEHLSELGGGKMRPSTTNMTDDAKNFWKNREGGKLLYQQGKTPVTETPEFKKWGNDAPVIKSEQAKTYEFKTGKKVVLEGFHGDKGLKGMGHPDREIDAFNTKSDSNDVTGGRQEFGTWFADNPDLAGNYANINGYYSEGRAIYPIFAKMKNPLVVDAGGAVMGLKPTDELIELVGKSYTGIGNIQTTDIAIAAKEKGYDGVIIRNIRDDPGYELWEEAIKSEPHNVYSVFEPEQIKSVNNRGTFDPEDPRILYQQGKTPATDTPEFKKWFGDSKVVDEDGKPLVVYHGTDVDFDQFRFDNSENPQGAFFTSSEYIARTYSGDDGIIQPTYLSLRNPLIVDAGGSTWKRIKGTSRVDDGSDLNKLMGRSNKKQKLNTNDIAQFAKNNGYDGAVIRNVIDRGGARKTELRDVFTSQKSDVYVVFEPTQIKSINNRGTFDPEDPRILYQKENTPQGAYSPQEQLILIARSADNPEATLRHEVLEAINDLGLFTRKEWVSLEDAARDGGWVKKHNIEQRYEGQFSDDIEANMIRESIAEEFSLWRRGEAEVDPKTQSLFERIVEMFKNIAAIVKGSGGESFESIFKKIEAGEFRERGYAQFQSELKQRQELQALFSANKAASGPIEDLIIDIDGEQFTPEALFKSADHDIAMAENIKLCAMMGA